MIAGRSFPVSEPKSGPDSRQQSSPGGAGSTRPILGAAGRPLLCFAIFLVKLRIEAGRLFQFPLLNLPLEKLQRLANKFTPVAEAIGPVAPQKFYL